VQAGIVTTTRSPGPPIVSFVAYHLSIGFARIFLFVDGHSEPGLDALRMEPRVTLITIDDALRERWSALPSFAVMAEHLDTEVMARQVLNAELAILLARQQRLDWLFHIDSDEALFFPRQSLMDHLLAAESRGMQQIVYPNHEAVPETVEVGDFFREVTLFKASSDISPTGSEQLFVAYRTGKSAVALGVQAMPHGVHRFRARDPGPQLTTQRSKSACVLHYPSCGFARYVNKYVTLGPFAERYFGTTSISQTVPFHWQSRLLVTERRMDEARRLYMRKIMLDGLATSERAELLARGTLVRISNVSDQLARIRDPWWSPNDASTSEMCATHESGRG
jgi:hypothetical protein